MSAAMNGEAINQEKAKMLRWAIEWMKYPHENKDNKHVDASELTSLMQCLGFTLESFEKLDNIDDDGVIRMEITCGKSRMKAVMSKQSVGCTCPSQDEATNAEIWNVSGCEPKSADRINVSNTSILPVVSPSKNRVVGEILQKVLELINDPNIDKISEDTPKTPKLQEARCKSLDSPKPIDGLVGDAEMLVEPPTISSTPVSKAPKPEKANGDLLRIFEEFAKLSEKGRRVLLGDPDDEKLKQKRISDIKVSPGAASSSYMNVTITKAYSEYSLSTAGGKRAKTPKDDDGKAKKKSCIQPPSKINIFKRRTVITNEKTPTRSRLQMPRVPTPRPSTPAKDGYMLGMSKARSASKINQLTPSRWK